MSQKLVNITPHSIKLVDAVSFDEVVVRQARNIRSIRVIQGSRVVDNVEHHGVTVPVKLVLPYEAPDTPDLPPCIPGTIYIVSRVVAECYKDTRPDFVFPYDFQRSPTGGILGCHSLAKFYSNTEEITNGY